MKTCRLCKQEKPLTDYYKARSTKDGRMFECKDCRRDIQRMYAKKRKKPDKTHKKCIECGEKKPINAYGLWSVDKSLTKRVCLVCEEQLKNKKPIKKINDDLKIINKTIVEDFLVVNISNFYKVYITPNRFYFDYVSYQPERIPKETKEKIKKYIIENIKTVS